MPEAHPTKSAPNRRDFVGAPDDARDQIRSRLDLVDVIQGYVRLTKRGSEWVGLCPFHSERTPSFYVNQQKQLWNCHGCSRGGDIFRFVEEYEKLDFKGALDLLADRAGVTIERDPLASARRERRRRLLDINHLAAQYFEYVLHSMPAGEPGRALLAQREVSEEVARRFRLGFAPGSGSALARYLKQKGRPIADAVEAGLLRPGGSRDFFLNRLVIPIRDDRGQTVGFTARAVDPAVPAKYVNTPETPVYSKGRVLFGLDLAKEEIGRGGLAVLVEGQFDVISCHQHGIPIAVASSGTALTEDQMRLLKRFAQDVLLVFDSDAAGQKATLNGIERASATGLRARVMTLPEGKDPDEFLRGAGEEAARRWEEAAARAVPEWEHWIRQSIEGLDLGQPRDQGTAAQRIKAVLARIPDEPTREAYRLQADKWAGIDPYLLQERTPRRAGSPEREPQAPARQRPGSAELLLQLLACRPEIAARVRVEVTPEDLGEERAATYQHILAAIDAGDEDGPRWQLDSFSESERDLIQAAWTDPPPGVENDAVVESVVLAVRRDALTRAQKRLIRQLKAAEDGGDRMTALSLEAEVSAIARAREALNNRARGGEAPKRK